MQARAILVQSFVLLAGLLAGFFFVFNFLFSDGPTSPLHAERLVTYLLVLAGAFLPAVLGARFGGRGARLRWALLSGGPGVLFAGLFLVGGLTQAPVDLVVLPAVYLLCVASGAWGGAWLGAMWRPRSLAD